VVLFAGDVPTRQVPVEQVTAYPVMDTVSPDTGVVWPPPVQPDTVHVPAEFQFPVAFAVKVQASAEVTV
jgi:hypothetical protein